MTAGDWVVYGEVDGFWNIPGQETPQFIKDAIATNWIRTDVQKVAGDNVTATQTWNFSNATAQRTVTLNGNVRTGDGNLTIFIISKGLVAGDPINEMSLAPTINRTMTRNYVGVNREVDVLNYTATQSSSFGSFSLQFLLFWDQLTGVLLESSFLETLSISPTGTFSGRAHILITETSLWQASAGQQGDFQLQGPDFMVVETGSTGRASVLVVQLNGFNGSVTLAADVSPSGPQATFDQTTVSWFDNYPVASSTIRVQVPDTTALGSYTITVTATSASKSHTFTIPLTVKQETPQSSQSASNTQLLFGLTLLGLVGIAGVLVAAVVVALLIFLRRKPRGEFQA